MLIFAGAWPRMLPSDFRVRSLDGVADDWPLTYDELLPYYERSDRHFGVSGMGGDPAYPPGGEDPPLPPLPLGAGRPEGRAGPHPARLALVAGAQLDPLGPVRRPPPVRPARHLPAGLQRGRQGVDRPHPLAQGHRARREAHHRRPRPAPRDQRRRARRPAPPGWTATAASTSRRRRSWCWPPTRSGRPGLLLLSASPAHPDGLANSSGLVGKRLMMHPFANVGGLFDEDLESWQGQFGCSIESFEFYETDERRGFVRGAKWGLAPTFGPINAALPSRAGTQVWGPDHHLHVRSHLGRGANWGLFGEDLPGRGQPRDAVEHPGGLVRDPRPGDPLPRCPRTPGGCWTSTSRRRPSRCVEAGAYKVEVDRLMRYSGWHLLGTARMGDDPRDVRARPLEPRARRPQPVRRGRQQLRDVGGRQPHVVHLRARPAGRGPHGRDPLRPAGAGMSAPGGCPADPLGSIDGGGARRWPPWPAC